MCETNNDDFQLRTGGGAMAKLKPCPFCGGKAGIYPDYLRFYMVQCNKCGIRTERKCEESEAINDWNRRENDEHE